MERKGEKTYRKKNMAKRKKEKERKRENGKKTKNERANINHIQYEIFTGVQTFITEVWIIGVHNLAWKNIFHIRFSFSLSSSVFFRVEKFLCMQQRQTAIATTAKVSEWAQGARTRLCLWLCELWMLCVCAVGNKYPFVTWCVCLLLACVFLHGERTLFSCGRFYTNYSIDRFCDRFELWQYALRPLQTFCEKFLSELETKRFQWNEHTNNKDGYLLINTI